MTEQEFVAAVLDGVARARAMHPVCGFVAVAEEFGEVARALQEESPARVQSECIQVAATALRLALEGDPYSDAARGARGLDPTVGA